MRQYKKIILFGGSFDPIHSGHLRVAHHTFKELDAEKLIFVPAHRSPHKTDFPAPGHHRLAMIKIAIRDFDSFSVSDCELSRPDPSYTLDTVRFFRHQYGPDAVLYWLIGADQIEGLEKWYRIGDLLKECRISVMVRAGYPQPDFRRFDGIFPAECIEQLRNDVIMTPRIDLSGTDIRHQLTCGKIGSDALSPAVLAYISKHRLYGYTK